MTGAFDSTQFPVQYFSKRETKVRTYCGSTNKPTKLYIGSDMKEMGRLYAPQLYIKKMLNHSSNFQHTLFFSKIVNFDLHNTQAQSAKEWMRLFQIKHTNDFVILWRSNPNYLHPLRFFDLRNRRSTRKDFFNNRPHWQYRTGQNKICSWADTSLAINTHSLIATVSMEVFVLAHFDTC